MKTHNNEATMKTRKVTFFNVDAMGVFLKAPSLIAANQGALPEGERCQQAAATS